MQSLPDLQPRAADREPPGVRNLSQLRDELSDSLRRHSADDDEIDVEGIGDIADRVEWRIRSQVLDPPAMRTQCEAEGDQPQLVLLSRDAPEERGDRRLAPNPARSRAAARGRRWMRSAPARP